jgi:carboxylesterase type B
MPLCTLTIYFILEKINSYDNPRLSSDHAEKLEAFFKIHEPFATSAVADAKDEALFHSMREYWTSFITTGRPVSNNWRYDSPSKKKIQKILNNFSFYSQSL